MLSYDILRSDADLMGLAFSVAAHCSKLGGSVQDHPSVDVMEAARHV